jgi:hypothetical protein
MLIMAGFYMCRFKAVNILTLLLPNQEGRINKVRKLDTIPPDFDDLPWIHKRADRKYTGHLEVQDTVILMIEMAGYHEVYEITCEDDGEVVGETDIFVVTLSRGYN